MLFCLPFPLLSALLLLSRCLPLLFWLSSFAQSKTLVIFSLLTVVVKDEFFSCSCMLMRLLISLVFYLTHFNGWFFIFLGICSCIEGKLSWTVLTVMIIANTSLAQSNPKLLLPQSAQTAILGHFAQLPVDPSQRDCHSSCSCSCSHFEN